MLDYEFVRSLEWKGTQDFETAGARSNETITGSMGEVLERVGSFFNNLSLEPRLTLRRKFIQTNINPLQ
jgi:hypothetical protein